MCKIHRTIHLCNHRTSISRITQYACKATPHTSAPDAIIFYFRSRTLCPICAKGNEEKIQQFQAAKDAIDSQYRELLKFAQREVWEIKSEGHDSSPRIKAEEELRLGYWIKCPPVVGAKPAFDRMDRNWYWEKVRRASDIKESDRPVYV